MGYCFCDNFDFLTANVFIANDLMIIVFLGLFIPIVYVRAHMYAVMILTAVHVVLYTIKFSLICSSIYMSLYIILKVYLWLS